ncbi:hypothetical protein MTR67_004797 [Solanum verrucosum]|uniref:Uncharacterized protein n=1 Tax=Solanum verrucosum TaxID=315347 RepID=A0AAF0PV35_SOLVR|nr:hypothetical protein MTR67_004797 [Solanum verrucosum]
MWPFFLVKFAFTTPEQFGDDLTEGNNQVLQVAETVAGLTKQDRVAKRKLLYCLSLCPISIFHNTVQDEFGINKENEVFFPTQSTSADYFNWVV